MVNLNLSFLNSIYKLVKVNDLTFESIFVAVDVWLGGFVNEDVDLLSISKAHIDK